MLVFKLICLCALMYFAIGSCFLFFMLWHEYKQGNYLQKKEPVLLLLTTVVVLWPLVLVTVLFNGIVKPNLIYPEININEKISNGVNGFFKLLEGKNINV